MKFIKCERSLAIEKNIFHSFPNLTQKFSFEDLKIVFNLKLGCIMIHKSLHKWRIVNYNPDIFQKLWKCIIILEKDFFFS